jgi:16S rRNA (cytosine1402-N4)-methyltransferase
MTKLKTDTNTKLHLPVMAKEVIEILKEMKSPLNRFLDLTYGRGGHSALVRENFPKAEIIAFDQDPDAVEHARKSWASEIDKESFRIVKDNFSNFNRKYQLSGQEIGRFDAILADLGVSSPQLDNRERGFSFREEGPLDMRMDPVKNQLTASDIVNTWTEDELYRIFRELGEVKAPQKVVRAILNDRKEKKFETTLQLSQMIERVDGWRIKGTHPATQYFLALRLEVNKELDVIRESLPRFVDALNPGGRLLVITFHSLEDRIVKFAIREFEEVGEPVRRKAIKPSREEEKINSRARSSLLRVFEAHQNENKEL